MLLFLRVPDKQALSWYSVSGSLLSYIVYLFVLKHKIMISVKEYEDVIVHLTIRKVWQANVDKMGYLVVLLIYLLINWYYLFKHSGSIPRNACVACET